MSFDQFNAFYVKPQEDDPLAAYRQPDGRIGFANVIRPIVTSPPPVLVDYVQVQSVSRIVASPDWGDTGEYVLWTFDTNIAYAVITESFLNIDGVVMIQGSQQGQNGILVSYSGDVPEGTQWVVGSQNSNSLRFVGGKILRPGDTGFVSVQDTEPENNYVTDMRFRAPSGGYYSQLEVTFARPVEWTDPELTFIEAFEIYADNGETSYVSYGQYFVEQLSTTKLLFQVDAMPEALLGNCGYGVAGIWNFTGPSGPLLVPVDSTDILLTNEGTVYGPGIILTAQRESETLYITFNIPIEAGTQGPDDGISCSNFELGDAYPSTSVKNHARQISIFGWQDDVAFSNEPEGFTLTFGAGGLTPTLVLPATGYTFVLPQSIQVYDL